MTALLVLMLVLGAMFGTGVLLGWVLRDSQTVQPPATMDGWHVP